MVRVLCKNLESGSIGFLEFAVTDVVDPRMLKAAGWVPAESWESAKKRLVQAPPDDQTILARLMGAAA